MGQGISIKDLVQMINTIMGGKVLTEEKMEKILHGARQAHEKGGMEAVLQYLMKVTQADVEMEELQQFAKRVQADPTMGMDILKGKRKLPRKK
ncbi:hypothetical protein [Staphylospora marina]|uniref:hypothetical protein n=1 Tax=Staphylospora marina TaxID=2490858 RepID=UPI000F5B8BAB|nr:hypothetical protein [Staphylospora marina]